MLKNSRFFVITCLLLFGCFLSSGRSAFADNLDDLLNGAKEMGDFLASGKGAEYYNDKVSVMSAVSGQPVYVWKTPLGDDKDGVNVDNNKLNRCKIIKTLKPGELEVMKARHNTEALLSRYATDLYVESVETEFDLDREKPVAGVAHSAEQTMVKREILARLANIATRLNVIVSLEARTAAMDNINKLSKVGAFVFGDYEYNVKDGTCEMSSETDNNGG